jgi:hypothetical protein
MTRRKNKTPKHDTPAGVDRVKTQAADPGEDRLRPWLLGAMTALLVARPLFPSESAAAHGDGMPMVMLWIALGVFWLLGAVGRPTFVLRFGCVDAAALALIAWNVVASLWAVWHGTPRPAVNMLWEWIGLGLCFFLARQFIVTPRERRAVAAVMVALAVAVSGYGLYQVCYEMPQTRAIYRANPDKTLREAGLSLPSDSPERKLFEDRLENREPMSTFALTNSLAAFLTPWLVMLLGVIACTAGSNLCRRSASDNSPVGGGNHLLHCNRLWAMLLCLIPVVVCLLLTKSRSGYAALAVGAFLVWLLSRAGGRCKTEGDSPFLAETKSGTVLPTKTGTVRWKLPAALAGVAVVLISAAIAIEGPGVLGKATKSFGYRLQYWQSSLRMIADHPWVGCGPGNFQAAYTQYKLPEASEEVADPHDFLLEIWATAGTPAALAFLALLVCWWRGGKASVGDPHAPTSALPRDAWLHVLGGGLLGFLLAVPLGILCAAPPGAMSVLVGIPLAAVTAAAMFNWIRDGRLPPWLPGVCIVALLVNLSAAGGIAYPSIAGTFWLLLALALDGRQSRTLRSGPAWVGLIGLMALAVVCYRTAYAPVLNCDAEMRLAEARLADHEPVQAMEHLAAATAADPLAAEPWNRRAAVELEMWLKQPDDERYSRYESARDKALALAPNSATMWMAAGDWADRAFEKIDKQGKRGKPDAIQSAVEFYGRAMELYPNSAKLRAKLAEAYLAAGDRAAFRREAEIALRLDGETPHVDKKLPPETRERLLRELAAK